MKVLHVESREVEVNCRKKQSINNHVLEIKVDNADLSQWLFLDGSPK